MTSPDASGSRRPYDFPCVNEATATPFYDELYDTARELGTCEVVIEHIPYKRRRPGLALVVRRTDDATTVHRAVIRSGVEEAASRIRESLEPKTSHTEEEE